MKENPGKRFGVARILSKQGLASRTQAAAWVREGRVSVNGRIVRDPEAPTSLDATITVDDAQAAIAAPVHVLLNKPRGLVTTRSDEQGRATVYDCFVGADLPWVAPVGRLDRASEGLLLFTNDSDLAHAITAPASKLPKTYEVRCKGPLRDEQLLELLQVTVEAADTCRDAA